MKTSKTKRRERLLTPWTIGCLMLHVSPDRLVEVYVVYKFYEKSSLKKNQEKGSVNRKEKRERERERNITHGFTFDPLIHKKAKLQFIYEILVFKTKHKKKV